MIGVPRAFSRRLLRWYDRHRRDLPWRRRRGDETTLDPYHVLVSEAMLQQTQVATVIPYFVRFIERFPTLAALAKADEQEVLRLWQGLGYYSRARNLKRAAERVIQDHGGKLPRSVEALSALPGVGLYTTGAIASIAFDLPAAIVDGNVARVLCRLDRIETDPRERATIERLWRRAEEILPRKRCGDFNSALMEMGATVCTPRSPKCSACPVREYCQAQAAGVQERIPAPKKAKPTPLLKRDVLCIRRGEKWLIEQRPATGRWARMWQFVTVERAKSVPAGSKSIGVVTHALTHRRYHFRVLSCRGPAPENGPLLRKWLTLGELDHFPLPRPHVKIAAMLREETRK
ncbi:MAG: A/G-specific adenine glycosylase [Tepidisphaeraceae bacterium]